MFSMFKITQADRNPDRRCSKPRQRVFSFYVFALKQFDGDVVVRASPPHQDLGESVQFNLQNPNFDVGFSMVLMLLLGMW
jgi:hypothetical protein